MRWRMAPAAAAAELAAWQPHDEAQRALKHALLAFLDARPTDACDRSCVPGHLTASALVLDAAGEHGADPAPACGSLDPARRSLRAGDATLRAAALREATEESGIAGLEIAAEPLHIDVHPVTCSLASDPAPRRALPPARPGRGGTGDQCRVGRPAVVAAGRPAAGHDTVPTMAALTGRERSSGGHGPSSLTSALSNDSRADRERPHGVLGPGAAAR